MRRRSVSAARTVAVAAQRQLIIRVQTYTDAHVSEATFLALAATCLRARYALTMTQMGHVTAVTTTPHVQVLCVARSMIRRRLNTKTGRPIVKLPNSEIWDTADEALLRACKTSRPCWVARKRTITSQC